MCCNVLLFLCLLRNLVIIIVAFHYFQPSKHGQNVWSPKGTFFFPIIGNHFLPKKIFRYIWFYRLYFELRKEANAIEKKKKKTGRDYLVVFWNTVAWFHRRTDNFFLKELGIILLHLFCVYFDLINVIFLIFFSIMCMSHCDTMLRDKNIWSHKPNFIPFFLHLRSFMTLIISWTSLLFFLASIRWKQHIFPFSSQKVVHNWLTEKMVL